MDNYVDIQRSQGGPSSWADGSRIAKLPMFHVERCSLLWSIAFASTLLGDLGGKITRFCADVSETIIILPFRVPELLRSEGGDMRARPLRPAAGLHSTSVK